MKKFKIFIDFATNLQPWINLWADRGFRLVDIKGCIYTFEKTDKRFKYAVQFIGGNSYKDNKQYVSMLKETGLNVFLTSINQLSFNYGKIRFRPYVEGVDKLSSSLNGYNKEILIVEMYEDEFTNLLTDKCDLISYYSKTSSAYVQGLVCISLLFIFALFNMNFNKLNFKELAFIALFLILIVKLFIIIHGFKRKIKSMKNEDY